MDIFSIRGFNLCESLLRHSPEQLRTFIRRMKKMNLNTLIVHYDYGWTRYRDIILEECRTADVEIVLMTFGPRTFFSFSDWKPKWFAKQDDGTPFTQRLECETHPCCFESEALEAFEYGVQQWLKSLPEQIRHVHMRAADGIMFCQCEKCRCLSAHERWQPFVDIFAKTMMTTRPDLKFETDVYIMRYHIPDNQKPFRVMSNIMYDTFYRHTFFPLGSRGDASHAPNMKYFATEPDPNSRTPNEYYLNRLREWCGAFPNKVYIHENAMKQSLFGTFQHASRTYLKDLEIYRRLGVQGVCYEAFEPGYSGFSDMFEVLSRAMNGEDPGYIPDALDEVLPKTKMDVFCNDMTFPLEEYISDPFRLKQALLFRRSLLDFGLDLFREYLRFGLENEAQMDPLFIGFFLAQKGLAQKKIVFRNLSMEADTLIHRRKLWDFMEDIPLLEDPRKICRSLMHEFYEKAVSV